MTNNHAMQTFESLDVRTAWDEDAEKWWFSALDIVAILTEQPDYAKTRNYWKWLKNKLIAEGSEVVSVTNQLKMKAPDGIRMTTKQMQINHVNHVKQLISEVNRLHAEF